MNISRLLHHALIGAASLLAAYRSRHERASAQTAG